MRQNQSRRIGTSYGYRAAAIVFWLLVWQLVSMWIEIKILFASPVSVFLKLWELIQTAVFWESIAFSFFRIVGGFVLALAAGIVLAIVSAASGLFRELLSPLMKLMKAVPVASFVILALLWVKSSNLSILISFLMVLPVIYANVLQGIRETDRKLLEMAAVFRVGMRERMRYIYLPSVLPYLVSACSVGLGFCWKSGIAAEVIGIPNGSIGRQLYDAKLYLMTEDLFAWTFVIVAVSVVFEKAVMAGIRYGVRELSEARSDGKRFQNSVKPIRESAKKSGTNRNRMEYGKKATPAASKTSTNKKPAYHRSDTAPQISVQNIRKSYDGQAILNRLNITFPAGTITCIMGASGIGKTTLLHILMGLIKPDSGTVQGLEQTQIAAVFQENRLCEGLDALGNIALTKAADVSGEDILQALREVGISETEAVGKPVSTFSGGMKRRVAIVRAVLAPGSVLLMDEAFGGLDEERKEEVIRFVRERSAGKTVVFITHDESEIEKMSAERVELR